MRCATVSGEPIETEAIWPSLSLAATASRFGLPLMPTKPTPPGTELASRPGVMSAGAVSARSSAAIQLTIRPLSPSPRVKRRSGGSFGR